MAYESRPDNMQRASSATKDRPSGSDRSSNIMESYHPSLLTDGPYDERMLEELRVAHQYMRMRKEIWQPLAAGVGLNWNVVEQMCMVTGLKKIQTHARAFARQFRLGETERSDTVTLVDLDDDSDNFLKDPLSPLSSMDLDDIFNRPSLDSAYASLEVAHASLDSGIGMCEFSASSTSTKPENDPGPPTEENNKGVDSSNHQLEIASPGDDAGSTVPPKEALLGSSADGCSAVSTEDASESYSFIRAFPTRKPLLSCVTQWFEQWLNQQCRSRPCGCDASESGDNSRSDIPASAGTTGTTPSSSRSKKRPAGDLTPNDDDGSRGNQKRPRIGATKKGERRFACPFFKRDPSRYKDLRSCPGPGWTSIHRLKEHLYRRHLLTKLRCARCSQVFDSDGDLISHQRAEIPCDLRSQEDVEGISAAQEKQLKARSAASKTEHQRWFDVYRILFADDDPSTFPTPYYEVFETQPPPHPNCDPCPHHAASSGVEAFVRMQAPQLLQQELGEFEPELKAIINEKLKSKLAEILPKLQAELISSFRGMNSESITQTTPDPTSLDEGGGAQDLGQQHQTSETFADSVDCLEFLQNMDWSLPAVEDFEVELTLPSQFHPEGSSWGSSGDGISAPTDAHNPTVAGDSGYGSLGLDVAGCEGSKPGDCLPEIQFMADYDQALE